MQEKPRSGGVFSWPRGVAGDGQGSNRVPFVVMLATYGEADAWIDEHAELFALNPRAVPLDPLAAGGAYDE
jgi:hypothetical protein